MILLIVACAKDDTTGKRDPDAGKPWALEVTCWPYQKHGPIDSVTVWWRGFRDKSLGCQIRGGETRIDFLTSPAAQLTVNGKPLPLDRQGRGSYRLALDAEIWATQITKKRLRPAKITLKAVANHAGRPTLEEEATVELFSYAKRAVSRALHRVRAGKATFPPPTRGKTARSLIYLPSPLRERARLFGEAGRLDEMEYAGFATLLKKRDGGNCGPYQGSHTHIKIDEVPRKIYEVEAAIYETATGKKRASRVFDGGSGCPTTIYKEINVRKRAGPLKTIEDRPSELTLRAWFKSEFEKLR